ncbi:hypothetical protein NL676_000543 [Syzygium grande]|nr:hypothetical protein NL676_000543 [Syzygium grande]
MKNSCRRQPVRPSPVLHRKRTPTTGQPLVPTTTQSKLTTTAAAQRTFTGIISKHKAKATKSLRRYRLGGNGI